MSTRTTAIGAYADLPVSDDDAPVAVEIEVGDPGPHDLLVEVRAVSVNPADVKVRAGLAARDEPRVLGFDAAVVVRAVGAEVIAFAPGDEVYYARDHRPAGEQRRPAAGRLPHHRAQAGHPRLRRGRCAAAHHDHGVGDVVRQVRRRCRHARHPAAGGVGSMAIELARARTGLRVVGTASRPESQGWARDMGKHDVADHHDLVATVRAGAPGGVSQVFSPVSGPNIDAYARLLVPRGEIVAIDEPDGLDVGPLKARSVTWRWELMFTRPMFEPEGAPTSGSCSTRPPGSSTPAPCAPP